MEKPDEPKLVEKKPDEPNRGKLHRCLSIIKSIVSLLPDEFKEIVSFVILDAIVLALIFISLSATHWLASRLHLIEENSKLFDLIPSRYISDLVTVLLFGVYVSLVIKKAINTFQKAEGSRNVKDRERKSFEGEEEEIDEIHS